MLSRDGLPIRCAYSETEIIYLRAAMTLPRGDRYAAFCDLEDILHRPFSAIRAAAYRLHQEDVARFAASVPQALPQRVVPRVASIPLSELLPVQKAARMAGRASSRRVREIGA